jgi:ketosteroid isomerase-like protein
MADHATTAAAIFEAFNRRDIDAMLAHLHPDYQITWSHGTLAGLDAMAHEATILDAMPDLRASVLAIHETADQVIVEVEMAGTQTGPLVTPEGPVIPPSGQRWVTPMVVVLAFEDGLLHRERIYADRFAPIATTGALDALLPAMDGR